MAISTSARLPPATVVRLAWSLSASPMWDGTHRRTMFRSAWCLAEMMIWISAAKVCQAFGQAISLVALRDSVMIMALDSWSSLRARWMSVSSVSRVDAKSDTLMVPHVWELNQ